MNILISIIFGIIEGITEWLPVSSTGHLILAEKAFSFNGLGDNFWNLFEVVIQLGAILAVVVLYFKNIWPLKNKVNQKGTKELRWDKSILQLWIKIIISCLPAIAIVVLKIDEWAEKYLYNPTCIAIMLIVVGIAFIVVENWNKNRKKKPRVEEISSLTYKDAIIIGLFQLVAALLPGTSRSGATIIGALMIGVARKTSAEYTFYLAIPAMAGASLLKLIKYGLPGSFEGIMVLLVGTFVAFAVSVLVIKFLMNYIKKHDFKVFGIYRIILGIIVIALSLAKVI